MANKHHLKQPYLHVSSWNRPSLTKGDVASFIVLFTKGDVAFFSAVLNNFRNIIFFGQKRIIGIYPTLLCIENFIGKSCEVPKIQYHFRSTPNYLVSHIKHSKLSKFIIVLPKNRSGKKKSCHMCYKWVVWHGLTVGSYLRTHINKYQNSSLCALGADLVN